MTVGSGISPDLLTPGIAGALAGLRAFVLRAIYSENRNPLFGLRFGLLTAGREFHPALRTFPNLHSPRQFAIDISVTDLSRPFMHPNPIYRRAETARNLAFARDRGFGGLCLNADMGPLVSHIPFVLDADGSSVELHLVRSNPILRLLDAPQPAVIAAQGPDSYISPDWYGIDDQVPTWNYVAVHLRGKLEKRPAEELRGMLDRLAAQFENRLLPKPAWLSTKMSADALDKMMRMIVPCRMNVESVDGTWKLNQNKDDAVRLSAADGVAEHGIGSGLADLAKLMRDPT